MEGFDDIEEISDKVQTLVEYIQLSDDDIDTSKLELRLKDLEAVLGEDLSMNASFPYAIPEDIELEIISRICDKYQDAIAEEWHKDEPRMKYYNEWSHEKAFREFEDYIVRKLADVIAEEMIAELIRPLLRSKYESVLRTQTEFEDFKAVYDRNK